MLMIYRLPGDADVELTSPSNTDVQTSCCTQNIPRAHSRFQVRGRKVRGLGDFPLWVHMGKGPVGDLWGEVPQKLKLFCMKAWIFVLCNAICIGRWPCVFCSSAPSKYAPECWRQSEAWKLRSLNIAHSALSGSVSAQTVWRHRVMMSSICTALG